MQRREFVTTSATVFAIGSRLRGAASNRVVLALIGAGGRGGQLAHNFVRVENASFKYLCEVNSVRGEEIASDIAQVQGKRPERVTDMRTVLEDKDVDAVVVATPEHWHALATIWACQAGKDVYVEKPPAISIWEGRKMIEAARKYNRIADVGTQNRSAPYGISAREYIQSGKLGRVVDVKAYNLLPDTGPFQESPAEDPPSGLDWDRFLGPARKIPYTPTRVRQWYNYWDYGGGALSGDAIHQLDLTRMVLGDPAPPKAVYCKGGRFAYADRREIPDVQSIVWDFDGFNWTCDSGTFTAYMKKFPNEVRYGKQWPNWQHSSCRVEIFGTKQLMMLGRHGAGWQVFEADGKIVAEDKGYFPDKWHQPDFVESVRSRKKPNGDIEESHQSNILVQMANVAYRLGNRWLQFDAAVERFVNDDRANSYLKPAYRPGFSVPDSV